MTSQKATYQAPATSRPSTASCHSRCRFTRTIGLCDGGANDAADRLDDLLLLLRGDACPEREAEVLAGGALGLRQVAFAVAEVGECRLEVERRLVVDGVADLRLAQGRGDASALAGADGEGVVDVARLVLRQLD